MFVSILIAIAVVVAVALAARVGRREENYTATGGNKSPRERSLVHTGTMLYTGRVAERRKQRSR
jgi:hypothetical protein